LIVIKRFEYKTVEIKPKETWKSRFDATEIDQILNELGKEGWELITTEDKNGIGDGSTEYFYYTFKREI
jgi:lambda repressor-like predicted transcriptional regulator